MSNHFSEQPAGQAAISPEDLSRAQSCALLLLGSLEETSFLLASCKDPLFADVTSVPDDFLCDAIRQIQEDRRLVESILAALSWKVPGQPRRALADQKPEQTAALSRYAGGEAAYDEPLAYIMPLKKLQQESIAYALTSIVRWEGQLTDRSLCSALILGEVVQHYATILDNAYAAGTLTDPAVLRLSEFLTEPTVRTFRAMAAEIPTLARWARWVGRFSEDQRPEADATSQAPDWTAPNYPGSYADDTVDESHRLAPEEIVAFMRTHKERVIVVMLSRCGDFTDGRIAATFGISRSKCYRYGKWFEGLSDACRGGIIAVGFAAAEKHGGSEQAFDITSQLIESYEAIEIISAGQTWE
jgi:hypothetical protein